jgi:hypothetical protein
MGNVTPDTIQLIQYVKTTDFPIDQIDWEENGEFDTSTVDDSQNVTDSLDPGVVHTQKLITDVTEMVDQNSDAKAKQGVTETLHKIKVSDSTYDLSKYLDPTQAAPQYLNQNQSEPQSQNVAQGETYLLVHPQGQITQGQPQGKPNQGSP